MWAGQYMDANIEIWHAYICCVVVWTGDSCWDESKILFVGSFYGKIRLSIFNWCCNLIFSILSSRECQFLIHKYLFVASFIYFFSIRNRFGSSSSQASQNSGDICRICHCESDPQNPLLTPCYCSGSLKYVHQSCLQQWLTASETNSCELCKFPFIMHTKIKPFNEVRIRALILAIIVV